jgi:leader peptidase (prepilin peptidase)/N-methyltransferase
MSMPDLSPTFVLVWWTLFGLCVGSFLNVCIHRFPLDDQSVFSPRRSYCPKCKAQLTWRENLPVLSWVLQRARCRHCGAPVHWRYPLVELLNAALWLVAAELTLNGAVRPDVLALLAVRSFWLSALLVATFVDFERFEIPDQVSKGGMFLAPVLCFLVPSLHADTAVAQRFAGGGEVDGAAALIGCFAGMAVGAGVLYTIGWLGSKAYGKEAMGFGDVKLMGAGGAFVGPGGVLVALLIAVFVASLFGVLNMLRFGCEVRRRDRLRGRPYGLLHALRIARVAGRYLPFGPYLALGLGIVLLAWKDVVPYLPWGL